MKNKELVMDHLGNWFRNTDEMCARYGVYKGIYDWRLKIGYTQEKALTLPMDHRYYWDHLDNEFETIKLMCSYYNITPTILYKRLKIGWSLKDALTTSRYYENSKELNDHYNSIRLRNEL